MGLGIIYGSIVSAVADATGDDSSDAVTKIKRLVNQCGKGFLNLGKFKFLRDQVTFALTTTTANYSGSGYLPATFKEVLNAYLLDGTTKCPLNEVGIDAAYAWPNPDDNPGIPDEFCITRIESGYYQIAFNRKPGSAYNVYFEISTQWVDASSDAGELVITKDFQEEFTHYVSMRRAQQQGDTELYTTLYNEWYNPINPSISMLGRIRAGISGYQRKCVKPRGEPFPSEQHTPEDYGAR